MVGCGGFIGAISRYAVSGWLQAAEPGSAFPWGTVIVNLSGCLLIGVVAGLVEARDLFPAEFRLFLLVGLLGGFTTFSTFGYETFAMLRDAAYLRALAYVGIQVLAGLALVGAGFLLGSRSPV